MSGPRITSGPDSKQDYATPPELIEAVEARFGKIAFDLAATAENTKNTLYFAPAHIITYEGEGKSKKEIITPHFDPKAFGYDALQHDWCKLNTIIPLSFLTPYLWLNPPFNDITTWAEKSRVEGDNGASILLLTPAMVGSNWFRDHIASVADVYFLNGRVSFDGKNSYPKDCMISHFGPEATGKQYVWNWRENRIAHAWHLAGLP